MNAQDPDSARHAVVTGGGSGIGLAIAARLAGSGHAVTLMGRDGARLAAAKSALPGAATQKCDVADPDSVATAFREAARVQGPVAILVNSAGIVRSAPFGRQSLHDWEDIWRINVMGCVHAIREVLEPMKALRSARIINIASTAALKGYAYVPAYTAAKHAVLGLTRSLALETATTGITVNALCPGYTDTDIVRDALALIRSRTGRSDADARAALTRANPQGRLIAPDEVAAAVCWLVSDAAGSVTGQALAIAGGEVM